MVLACLVTRVGMSLSRQVSPLQGGSRRGLIKIGIVGLCTRFSLVALVVPLWEVSVGSTPKPPPRVDHARLSGCRACVVFLDRSPDCNLGLDQSQTVISTLIEIEGYDSPA